MTIPPLVDGNPADRSASVRPEAATPDADAHAAVDRLAVLLAELGGTDGALAERRVATILARPGGPRLGTLAAIALVATGSEPDPTLSRLAAALLVAAMAELGRADARTTRDMVLAALGSGRRAAAEPLVDRLDQGGFSRRCVRAALVAYEAEHLLAGRPPHGPDRKASHLAYSVAQAHRFTRRYAADVRAGNDTLGALEAEARTDVERLEVARVAAALGAFPVGAFVELFSGEIAVVLTRPTAILDYARPTVQLVLTRTFEPHPPGVFRVDLTTAPHASQIVRAIDPSEARFAPVEQHLEKARTDRRSTAPAPSDFPRTDARLEPEEIALAENHARERLPRPERVTPLVNVRVPMVEKVTPLRPLRAPPSARVVRSWEPKQRVQEPEPSTRRVEDPIAAAHTAEPPTPQVQMRADVFPPPPRTPTIDAPLREPRRTAAWGAKAQPPAVRESLSSGLRWPRTPDETPSVDATPDPRAEPAADEAEKPKKVDASSWGNPKKPRG